MDAIDSAQDGPEGCLSAPTEASSDGLQARRQASVDGSWHAAGRRLAGTSSESYRVNCLLAISLKGPGLPETINWSVTFEAVLGPRISESGTSTVAAYDKLSVQLDGNAVDVDIGVQPSASAGDVELLVLTASSYEADVTFSVDAGETNFVLNGPVVLVGPGPVSLLAAAPQTLRFSNPHADPVDIDILVGRQA
jgi:hypothetical protein